MFAVLQQKGNGDKPFNMQVFNSSITGAETVFANIGGELTLEDVRVDSSTLMSLSSTGSSTGSVGATFVRGVEVANSDVMVRARRVVCCRRSAFVRRRLTVNHYAFRISLWPWKEPIWMRWTST
jgi:hypothetical protein